MNNINESSALPIETSEQSSHETGKTDKLYGGELVKKVGLFRIVYEDLKRHHGDWTTPGFQAMAVYRLGSWAQKTRNWPFKILAKIFHWLAFRFVRNFYGIEIYPTTNIGRRLQIGHQNGIVIHAFGTIGDDCVIRQGVTLGVGNTWEEGVGPVVGDRVSFGVGCIVVGNVTIGDDVMIGPNSVITTNVPANRATFAPQARVLPRQPETN